ncbi:MAG: hypothetical protein Q7T93_16440 [Methylobacterium sp.]|uniref:hypothetical protein n=1 Tax=Methylobacterium sp. TaxID=409 RepID=UPI002728D499|nr:hypothetical protein [Methylobacterium sp.]MDO9428406.1 hypothetical protein [Methylobacterium sp.]
MEQGNRLDSTPVSAAQAVRDDAGENRALDAAVTALLTRADPAPGPADDRELLQLGAQYDAAHAAWLDAVHAGREAFDRYEAPIQTAKARGRETMATYEAAWALPGVREAEAAENDAFLVGADLADKIFALQPATAKGLAVTARAVIPSMWTEGNFAKQASLGKDEDSDKAAVRSLVGSVLALAGVDWKGVPVASADSIPAIQPSPSDLADACVAQVQLLDWWDKNPGAFSEAEANEEMDRWGAVFRRAIDEPSTGPQDLAGKAILMLADLNRFMPEDEGDYATDNYRLMRVIMREAITMGGLAYPAPARDRAVVERRHGDTTIAGPVADALDVDQHDYAFHAVSTNLRLAKRDYERSVSFADRVWVEQNGGDLSNEAMALAEDARDAAGARQEQAWRDLFKVRPRTNHQMWLLLRDVAAHFDDHQGMANEPDVFGALIGAADGLRAGAPELVAPHDLTRLSIAQLEDLADICSRQSRAMLNASKGTHESPLGSILEDEQYRIGRLGGMASDEIERRVPVDDEERNLRLETLARTDLAGNGYIEPKLLSELVAAWGAR